MSVLQRLIDAIENPLADRKSFTDMILFEMPEAGRLETLRYVKERLFVHPYIVTSVFPFGRHDMSDRIRC